MTLPEMEVGGACVKVYAREFPVGSARSWGSYVERSLIGLVNEYWEGPCTWADLSFSHE